MVYLVVYFPILLCRRTFHLLRLGFMRLEKHQTFHESIILRRAVFYQSHFSKMFYLFIAIVYMVNVTNNHDLRVCSRCKEIKERRPWPRGSYLNFDFEFDGSPGRWAVISCFLLPTLESAISSCISQLSTATGYHSTQGYILRSEINAV